MQNYLDDLEKMALNSLYGKTVTSELYVPINIKYHEGSAIVKQNKNGDWIDLATDKFVTLDKGEFKLISLGVSMELPEGYEALVIPRSSTFKRWGILMVNSIGLIDESYKGDNDIWMFPALATKPVTIPKNTYIAQFRIIQHQPKIVFYENPTLGNSDRGGFGSTDEVKE